MSVILTDLPAGHVFDPVRFAIDAAAVRAYCAAAGDALSLYEDEGVAPPLAAAALCLGALLREVGLPPGTLHISEALEFAAPVPLGAEVECLTTLAQRSRRSGFIVTVLDSRLMVGGASALTARATVISPAS